MDQSINSDPVISVVMAVKNGGQAVREAVKSILNQTFKDFEFIIINDGSEDETLFVLDEFNDPRIKVLTQANRGVARAANHGIEVSRGKYIARQDHDDISLPTRFEKQVEYLESHPDCGLLGTAAEIWSEGAPTGRFLDHPVDPLTLRLELLFNNPFVHSSIMFRRDCLGAVGLYTPIPEITPLDDFEFISRFSSKYSVANLSDRLMVYMETPKSLTSAFRNCGQQGKDGFNEKLARISAKNIADLNNLLSSDEVSVDFGRLIHDVQFKASDKRLSEIEELIRKSIKIAAKGVDDRLFIADEFLHIKVDNLRYRWYKPDGPAYNFNRNYYIFKNKWLRLLKHQFFFFAGKFYRRLKYLL